MYLDDTMKFISFIHSFGCVGHSVDGTVYVNRNSLSKKIVFEVIRTK